MIFSMRITLVLLILFSCAACHESEPPCVGIRTGVYGWTGELIAEPGGGFQRHSLQIAWLAEARDGDQMPRAVVTSRRDGFFEIELPEGDQILCGGTGDHVSFHVDDAYFNCMTVFVIGLEQWSYVFDMGDGQWNPDYGPEVDLCEPE